MMDVTMNDVMGWASQWIPELVFVAALIAAAVVGSLAGSTMSARRVPTLIIVRRSLSTAVSRRCASVAVPVAPAEVPWVRPGTNQSPDRLRIVVPGGDSACYPLG